MAQSMRVSAELIRQTMQSKVVRDALTKKASKGKARADQLAASEDVKMTTKVVSGTRPKGRPYSNIVGDNPDQEYGTSKVERRRILGRAAEGL